MIDQLLVGMIVGGALGFFAFRFFRRKKGCSGCGCETMIKKKQDRLH